MADGDKDRTELEREHSRDPEANPGNISEDPEPHHTLNDPADAPDEAAAEEVEEELDRAGTERPEEGNA